MSREATLEAARCLFLRERAAATTAEIATRPGVSEGVLSKRFGNKAELLKEAMTVGMVGSRITQDVRAQGQLRPQHDLSRLIRCQLNVLRDVLPIVSMAWSLRYQRYEMPLDQAGSKPTPFVAVWTFADVLQEEMEARGPMRRSAEALSRVIVGSLWCFLVFRLVFNKTRGGTDEDNFVQALARLIFGDLDPASETPNKRRVVR